MRRSVTKAALLCLLAALAVAGGVWLFAQDPRYTAREWLALGRYGRYDALIADAAHRHGVDPLLIKAVVWRESAFRPGMVGKVGERGLMQVGEAAAADWVRHHKVQTFVASDLFSPRMNVEIGTWYLARALAHWAGRDDAEPYALAEYNAGRRRVDRWVAEGEPTTAAAFRQQIGFPSTAAYVEAILARRAYYQAREKSSLR